MFWRLSTAAYRSMYQSDLEGDMQSALFLKAGETCSNEATLCGQRQEAIDANELGSARTPSIVF